MAATLKLTVTALEIPPGSDRTRVVVRAVSDDGASLLSASLPLAEAPTPGQVLAVRWKASDPPAPKPADPEPDPAA